MGILILSLTGEVLEETAPRQPAGDSTGEPPVERALTPEPLPLESLGRPVGGAVAERTRKGLLAHLCLARG